MSKEAAPPIHSQLEKERKVLRNLLRVDCIRLGLLDKKRAEAMIQRLSGKSIRQAEDEILTELRNILHHQISQFIRDNNGGPWETISEQQNIRLEIGLTPNVSFLVQLTIQLFAERKKWLKENNKWLGSGKDNLLTRIFSLGKKNRF